MMVESPMMKLVKHDAVKQLGGFCLIALCIFSGVYSSVFVIAAFVLCLYILVTKSNEYMLELMFFLLPMAAQFKLAAGQSSLLSILVIPFILKSLYKNKTFSATLVGLLLMVAMMLYNNSYYHVSRCKDVLICLLTCYVVMTGNMALHYEKIVNLFTIGVIVGAAAALISLNTPLFKGLVAELTVMEVQGEDVARFRGLYNNANFYTLDITMLFGCYMCLYCEKKALSIPQWVLLTVMLVFGVLSGSFSFLVTSIVTVLVVLLYLSRKSFAVMLRTSVLFIVVLGIVVLLAGDGTRSLIMYRIDLKFVDAESLGQVTTGRSDLQTTYLEYILGSLHTMIVGDGLAAPYIGSMGMGPHNTYIDMIYYLGILGTIIYVGSLLSFMRVRVRFLSTSFYQWFPAVSLLIRYFAISLLFFGSTAFYYILIWLSFTFAAKNKERHAPATIPMLTQQDT